MVAEGAGVGSVTICVAQHKKAPCSVQREREGEREQRKHQNTAGKEQNEPAFMCVSVCE